MGGGLGLSGGRAESRQLCSFSCEPDRLRKGRKKRQMLHKCLGAQIGKNWLVHKDASPFKASVVDSHSEDGTPGGTLRDDVGLMGTFR